LSTSDYAGNPGASSTLRLAEVTEKLEKKRPTLPMVVNSYKQTLNATRFIGKRYLSGPAAWDDFDVSWDEKGFDFNNDYLARSNIDFTKVYKDGNTQDARSIIGLMRHVDQDLSKFEYWLGFFTPENTPVPEGYEFIDFPETDIGVCWIYGQETEVFGVEHLAFAKLKEEDLEPNNEWFFERYVSHRESMDKNKFRIMDICCTIKPKVE